MLWVALRDLLTAAATMGTALGTPGEDLIVNVELWERQSLRVSRTEPVFFLVNYWNAITDLTPSLL